MVVLQAAAVALVAGLLALLVWRVVVSQHGSNFVSAIADGKRPAAPAFTLPVIWPAGRFGPPAVAAAAREGRLSLDALRGTPVVVNFFASWCAPCKDEARLLNAAARQSRGRVAFLAVDVQDFTGEARRFLRAQRVPYLAVRDGDNSTYEAYGLTGVPETFYLDARGRAVAHTPGPVTAADLADGLRAIGARAAPAAG